MSGMNQLELLAPSDIGETPDYLQTQLITYIGNKRALIPATDSDFVPIKDSLGKDHLPGSDAAPESRLAALYFNRHAQYLTTMHIEDYGAVVSRCCLKNRVSPIPIESSAVYS